MDNIPYFKHFQINPTLRIMDDIPTILKEQFEITTYSQTEHNDNIFIKPKGGFFCKDHNRHHDNKSIVITRSGWVKCSYREHTDKQIGIKLNVEEKKESKEEIQITSFIENLVKSQ